MRKTLGVCLLALLLAGPAAAGEMPNPAPAPAPTPTPVATSIPEPAGDDIITDQTAAGEMPNPVAEALTQSTLDLLLAASSLLL
jgi:hypothetical protein